MGQHNDGTITEVAKCSSFIESCWHCIHLGQRRRQIAIGKRTLRKVRELHNLSRRHSLQRCTSISHSRNPHCTQAAQQCRLWPARELPKGRRRTDLPFHFSGRPSAALDHPQELATLFLPLQSASHFRPCDACGRAHAVAGRALGKEGIMHARLSPSWKKI